MVIVKSREKAQILREQEVRAQQQQQQQQENNDNFHYTANGNELTIDSTFTSLLSQQFITGFRQSSDRVQQQPHAGDGKLAHPQHLQHSVTNSLAAQKAATQVLMQNLQTQQQQQQQQHNILQRQLQQQGLVRSLSSGSTPQQIHKNNMLLTMVRIDDEE